MKAGKPIRKQVATPHKSKKPASNPFLKYVGAFPAFKNLDEINAWVREMRENRPIRRIEIDSDSPGSDH